jgi:hypothetical protein
VLCSKGVAMPELTPEQKHQVLFMQLVLTFQQAAWQQLGKIPDPIHNKITRDLEQARHSIDLLDMLKARTKGNLGAEEAGFLDQILRELKLNYLDEVDRDKQATTTPEEKSAGAESESKSE